MGNKKSRKKGALVWTRLCACVLSAAVFVGASGDSTLQTKAAGASSIASLEQKAKEIAEENEKRQKQIDDLDADINENENAMDLVNDQIDGVNEEIDTYSALITAKQEDIDQKLIDIANVEQIIAEKEKTIEDKKVEIGNLQAENKKNLEKFGKLARYMYMNNASSQLPVLNGSDDWYDYFVYSDVVKNISGQNYDFMKSLQDSIALQEDMITDLNNEIVSLESEKNELETQKADYEKEAAALEEEKSDLLDYADERRDYLYGLAADNDNLKSQIKGLNAEIEAANAEREELNAQIEELIRQAQEEAKKEENYVDYSGDGFMWPLDRGFHYITTYFGWDAWRAGMHRGIDIGDGGIAGANIYASQSGTVISIENYCTHNYGKSYSCGCGRGYGNYIIVDHGGGMSTLYAHCQAIYVSVGEQVQKGQVIGAVGTTGWSTGYHLHFEVRENGVAVNPFNYVSYE